MALDKVKTEHAGAKNGGGAWATRSDAKVSSKKLRRRHDADAILRYVLGEDLYEKTIRYAPKGDQP